MARTYTPTICPHDANDTFPPGVTVFCQKCGAKLVRTTRAPGLVVSNIGENTVVAAYPGDSAGNTSTGGLAALQGAGSAAL